MQNLCASARFRTSAYRQGRAHQPLHYAFRECWFGPARRDTQLGCARRCNSSSSPHPEPAVIARVTRLRCVADPSSASDGLAGRREVGLTAGVGGAPVDPPRPGHRVHLQRWRRADRTLRIAGNGTAKGAREHPPLRPGNQRDPPTWLVTSSAEAPRAVKARTAVAKAAGCSA